MRLTVNQQRVLAALRQAAGPLSAYALLARLREQGFSAPAQVYRALERLTAQGLVHRLESLNAYLACRQTAACGAGLRAFAICDECGQVNEFVDPEVGRCLGHWMREHAFSLRQAAIELHGQCAACGAREQATHG